MSHWIIHSSGLLTTLINSYS